MISSSSKRHLHSSSKIIPFLKALRCLAVLSGDPKLETVKVSCIIEEKWIRSGAKCQFGTSGCRKASKSMHLAVVFPRIEGKSMEITKESRLNCLLNGILEAAVYIILLESDPSPLLRAPRSAESLEHGEKILLRPSHRRNVDPFTPDLCQVVVIHRAIAIHGALSPSHTVRRPAWTRFTLVFLCFLACPKHIKAPSFALCHP